MYVTDGSFAICFCCWFWSINKPQCDKYIAYIKMWNVIIIWTLMSNFVSVLLIGFQTLPTSLWYYKKAIGAFLSHCTFCHSVLFLTAMCFFLEFVSFLFFGRKWCTVLLRGPGPDYFSQVLKRKPLHCVCVQAFVYFLSDLFLVLYISSPELSLRLCINTPFILSSVWLCSSALLVQSHYFQRASWTSGIGMQSFLINVNMCANEARQSNEKVGFKKL